MAAGFHTVTILYRFSKPATSARVHYPTIVGPFLADSSIRREKIRGRFVYFAAVEQAFNEQKSRRVSMTRITQLPRDTEAILILVETIKNPHLSVEALSVKLRQSNCVVTPESISNLFAYHGLTVKKTPEAPF
jgi:hypothetical protein